MTNPTFLLIFPPIRVTQRLLKKKGFCYQLLTFEWTATYIQLWSYGNVLSVSKIPKQPAGFASKTKKNTIEMFVYD